MKHIAHVASACVKPSPVRTVYTLYSIPERFLRSVVNIQYSRSSDKEVKL